VIVLNSLLITDNECVFLISVRPACSFSALRLPEKYAFTTSKLRFSRLRKPWKQTCWAKHWFYGQILISAIKKEDGW